MELRLEFLVANMGLHKALSNTPCWSPMKGAALSTTLLDPLQRHSACNTTEQLQRDSCAKYAGPRRQRNVKSITTRTVKRVAKVQGLSSHTLASERKGKFVPRTECKIES